MSKLGSEIGRHENERSISPSNQKGSRHPSYTTQHYAALPASPVHDFTAQTPGTEPHKHASSRSPARKDDFDYSKVPTGPRGQNVQWHALVSISDDKLMEPFVFINGDTFPAKVTSVPHLRARLKKFSPKDILVDASGYYVIFQTSEGGQQSLRECFKEFNGKLMWREHVMNMECFPDGAIKASQNSALVRLRRLRVDVGPIGTAVEQKAPQTTICSQNKPTDAGSYHTMEQSPKPANNVAETQLGVPSTQPYRTATGPFESGKSGDVEDQTAAGTVEGQSLTNDFGMIDETHEEASIPSSILHG
ncbi:histone methyltransferase set1 [Elasticomyces elasticus]|nr:histone methyltransferase set1 [Elasticomyces elasticus]